MRQRIARPILAAFFIVTGTIHFITPGFYLRIMPPYIPWHVELVYLSGVLEIVGGILVLTPLQRSAGWFLIVLLIAVFPANIQMALEDGTGASRWWWTIALWLRLPLQGVLVWWVWRTCLRRMHGARPLRI
jgi:uncharacterized membrane protein